MSLLKNTFLVAGLLRLVQWMKRDPERGGRREGSFHAFSKEMLREASDEGFIRAFTDTLIIHLAMTI